MSSPCSEAMVVTSCSCRVSSASSKIVYTQVPSGTEDVGQVEAYGAIELIERAGLGLPVRPPAPPLRGVPKPGALHVVVGHLDHELGPQRHPGQVFLGFPPAHRSW